MIYATITDVVLIHKVYNLHDCFFIMGRVTINLDVKNMSAASELMIGSFNFRLMARRAVIVDRDMVGISVIILICYPFYYAE